MLRMKERIVTFQEKWYATRTNTRNSAAKTDPAVSQGQTGALMYRPSRSYGESG